jgi:hypothetical protein
LVVAFRQQDESATVTVPLRGIPDGRTFDVVAAPTGTVVGRYTSAQLRAGLPVSVASKDGAVALLIQPV